MPQKKSLQISIDSVKSSDVTIIGGGKIEIQHEQSLLASTNRLANVLQKRFSLSSNEDILEMTNVLLDKITERIESGDQIAFVQRKKDGSVGLVTLTFEKANNMMGEPSISLQVTFLQKEQITQIGDLALYANYYLIENPTASFNNEAIVPSIKEHVYISFEDALQWTGLTPEMLNELCLEKKIEAIQTSDNWVILWDSLKRYISNK